MKEIQKQVIEGYIKSYNDFDIGGMTKHLSKDVVFENISNGKVELRTEGIGAFRNQANSATQYFSQRT